MKSYLQFRPKACISKEFRLEIWLTIDRPSREQPSYALRATLLAADAHETHYSTPSLNKMREMGTKKHNNSYCFILLPIDLVHLIHVHFIYKFIHTFKKFHSFSSS